ncbi:hypothetical protein HTT03_09400 [Sulfitobacter sp. S0837]|uniref:hypothetical protein n=1 Tax=Sulfitobacter maritimus TaxID=2741719 RepID=UPI001581E480|nr:hypothetical protein [Sulfitobacter maritimus]NUH65500.1 hypothetical protein [Sulfitobacter maritimus]
MKNPPGLSFWRQRSLRISIQLLACLLLLGLASPGQSTDIASVLADLQARAASYKRPYGSAAPWNIPVRGLPIHDKSAYYAQLMWQDAPNTKGNYNLSFVTYTYPVYKAADAAGVIEVRTRWRSNINRKKIPWHPSWRPAAGNDGQVIVLDEARGLEWNLFQVKPRRHHLLVTNGNRVPGDYRSRTKGYEPSRGIGIPYLAMLVRPEEIFRGRIEHALSMPISNPDGRYYLPPATKLENAHGGEGIPLGMRFALRVSDAEIETWVRSLSGASKGTQRSARIIARALRDYGWFVTDTSGSASFQFESTLTAGPEWKLLGLGNAQIGDRVLPRDLLDGLIRPERIYVIAPSNKY